MQPRHLPAGRSRPSTRASHPRQGLGWRGTNPQGLHGSSLFGTDTTMSTATETIVIGDKQLAIEDLVRVARHGAQVELSSSALERIKTCRTMLDRKIEARETMYGVNTGIGELAHVVLDDEQVQQFQRYLIYNHAAGIGKPCPIEHVRAAMLSRVRVHSQGYSGCRPEITQTYVAMLNRGVTPVVCEKGSVGACGDLAPMSQIALSLMGEGEAFYQGERMATSVAMEKAGIPVPGLKARDGLAAINGSNLITGIGSLLLYDIERWIKQAEIATAMSLEALMANPRPYMGRLHELRGFKRRREVRHEHPHAHGRLRPHDRAPQGEGPGRLLHAIVAPGDRIAPRRPGLRTRPVRDRVERRGRQSHLRCGGQRGLHGRQLPGHAHRPAPRHGGRGA